MGDKVNKRRRFLQKMGENLPSADIWEAGGGRELSEKLRLLKEREGFTTQMLSDCSGVPLGTLNKILSGATKDPSLKTVERLARFFGLPMRYFCDVYPSGQSRAALLEQEVEQPLLLTEEEYQLIWSLRRFTGRERRILLTMVKTFDALHRPDSPARQVLPCYLPTRAEGGRTAVNSIAVRHISVKDGETARAADFAVVLYGSAMEPAYHAGEALALSHRPAGQDEIGLFNLNGEGYIRLYQKVRGGVRLAALNRAFPNISVEEGSQFCCLGTVVGRLDLL